MKKYTKLLLVLSFSIALSLLPVLLLLFKLARNNTIRNVAAQSSNLLTINYQASSDDIANPDRGFMKQANIWVDQSFSPSKISVNQPTDSLVWVYFHLENYRDPDDAAGKLFCPYFNPCDSSLGTYQGKPLEPIGSGKGLDTVNKAFAEARNKGLKLIIRFLYVGYGGIGSNSDPKTSQPDAPLSLAQDHINQLAPLINQNKDVIAAGQFGFVGYWGEWHSSKYLHSLDARRSVMNAVLTAFPNDRMIQVRYPRYVPPFFGGPLTDTQGFNQSDLARIGIHNDAMFRDPEDGGTYKSTVSGTKITNYCDGFPGGEIHCWKDFISKQARFTPYGGEAGTHSSTPDPSADCVNAVPTMENLHLSFLHDGYSKVTLNHWVNQGCMPEIRRRMGYRFVLSKLNLSQQVAPGGLLTFNLELMNEGFASPYNPRPVLLVLKEKSTGQQKEILLPSVDLRRWWSGQITNINLQVPIPANLPQGTYNLYLWLPDASQSINLKPPYAVRFANQNVWQASTGTNLLFDNLIISGTPITPLPTNSPTPGGISGDTNGDGKVNLPDFITLATNYGITNATGPSQGDFNSDQNVNLSDFVILASNWTG